jgi:hypothetical protein
MMTQLIATLLRIPQGHEVFHSVSVNNVMLDLQVARSELLGFLPLTTGGFLITFDPERDLIVFRRTEPRRGFVS